MKLVIAMMMALAAALALAGCSTTTTIPGFTVCDAVGIAQTEVVAAKGAVPIVQSLHASKQMSDANYQNAQLAYSALAATNMQIGGYLVIVNDAGGNFAAVSGPQYAALAAQAALEAAQFYALFASQPAKAVAGGTCTMADADITSALTMPPWPAQ